MLHGRTVWPDRTYVDATATAVTAPAGPTPISAPRSTSSPWQTPAVVTPEMHDAVDRYLMDKGLAYLDELLAMVAEIESAVVVPAAPRW